MFYKLRNRLVEFLGAVFERECLYRRQQWGAFAYNAWYSAYTRALRAQIIRYAGGFRLRDAMGACGALAGAQRARVAPRRPRGHDDRMFTAGKNLSQVGPINGLRTGTPPTGRE